MTEITDEMVERAAAAIWERIEDEISWEDCKNLPSTAAFAEWARDDARAALTAALSSLAEGAETPVTLTYTNWHGETSERTILPRRVWFGATEWHPEAQWLLSAIDVEKGVERDFALKDFGMPPSLFREQAERIERLEKALAHYAITKEYDYRGDVPEFCGWWCLICKEHVAHNGSGHSIKCLIHGQAPQGRLADDVLAALADGGRDNG